jgi:ribosomal protein S4
MFCLSGKYRVCRSFNADLWGALRSKRALNRTFTRFVKQYKQRRSPPSPFARALVTRRFKRRSLYGQVLHFRKKLTTFYGGVKLVAPRWRTSQEQLLHFLFRTVSSFESRLTTLVYRSNFSLSILESLHLVLSGNVLVNKKVIRNTNYSLNPGDVFELVDSAKQEKRYDLRLKAKERRLVLLQPAYLEVNYSVMSAILLYKPFYKEVYFPFRISF